MVNHLIKFLPLLQYMIMNETTNGGAAFSDVVKDAD